MTNTLSRHCSHYLHVSQLSLSSRWKLQHLQLSKPSTMAGVWIQLRIYGSPDTISWHQFTRCVTDTWQCNTDMSVLYVIWNHLFTEHEKAALTLSSITAAASSGFTLLHWLHTSLVSATYVMNKLPSNNLIIHKYFAHFVNIVSLILLLTSVK